MNNSKLVGIVATVLVVALVIAGLFAVGSPSTARDLRADQQRRQYLNDLHFELAQQVAAGEEIPESLEDLEPFDRFGPGYDPRLDPETGELFEYTKLSATEYEVCATFNTSIEEAEGYRFFGELEHDAGRNCYERDADDPALVPEFAPPRVAPIAPTEEETPGASPTPEATPEETASS